MKYLITILIYFFLAIFKESIYAQDPHFSQFFAAPLLLNPAFTGNTDADYRIITNYRQQYLGASAPFNTFIASFDTRTNLSRTKSSFWGIGGMAMRDESLNGAFKSTYASLDAAYHFLLDENEQHHIALGAGVTYGMRNLDFSQLSFEQQFTSSGFNTNLPSGEQALTNLKSYLSVDLGLFYRFSSEAANLEFGISGYHFNTPKQSFFEDTLESLPVRYVITNSFDMLITERAFLNTHILFQQQAGQNYLSGGMAVGYFLNPENDKCIGAGIWYRSKDAFYPYLSLEIQNIQFGLSYDIAVSNLKNYSIPPKSWELSFVFKKKTDRAGPPCPPSLFR